MSDQRLTHSTNEHGDCPSWCEACRADQIHRERMEEDQRRNVELGEAIARSYGASQPDMFGASDVTAEGRDPLDRYFTPAWATRPLIDYLGTRLQGLVLEPCAGAGHIVDVLRAHAEYVYRVLESDIAPSRPGMMTRDFLSTSVLPIPDWIVSNPPYTTDQCNAADIVAHALDLCPRVAMLLRLGWVEPTKGQVGEVGRWELFFRDRPPTDMIVLPRVNYIGAPNQNNQTSVWVIWDHAAADHVCRTVWYGPEIREPGYWQRRGA